MTSNSRWVKAVVIVLVTATLAACAETRIPVAGPTNTPTATTPALIPATPGRSTNSRDFLIQSRDEQRRYRTHVPLAAPPGPRPLLVLLHAGGSSPQTMEFTIGMDSVADRLGIFVAYPEALGGYWNNQRAASVRRSGGRDDRTFVRDVVRDVQRRSSIDSSRIFVGGHADGAIMAALVAAKYPETFSGLAMVSGQLLARPALKPSATTPVLIIHGTRDPLFPYAGTEVAKTGPLLSVDDTVRVFLGALKVKAKGVTTARPDRDPRDGTRVSRTTWGPPSGDPLVTLYRVQNGGSPWPGGLVQTRSSVTRGRTSRDLDASAVIGHFVLDTRRDKAS